MESRRGEGGESVEDKNGARLRCASSSTKVSVCGGVNFARLTFLLREAEIRWRRRKYQPRKEKWFEICVARLERKKVARKDKKVVKISFPSAQNEAPAQKTVVEEMSTVEIDFRLSRATFHQRNRERTSFNRYRG